MSPLSCVSPGFHRLRARAYVGSGSVIPFHPFVPCAVHVDRKVFRSFPSMASAHLRVDLPWAAPQRLSNLLPFSFSTCLVVASLLRFDSGHHHRSSESCFENSPPVRFCAPLATSPPESGSSRAFHGSTPSTLELSQLFGSFLLQTVCLFCFTQAPPMGFKVKEHQ